MQCNAMPYNTMDYYIMHYDAMEYDAMFISIEKANKSHLKSLRQKKARPK